MQYRICLACIHTESMPPWKIVGHRSFVEPVQWWELYAYRQEVHTQYGENSGLFSVRVKFRPSGAYDVSVLSLYWPDFTVSELSERLNRICERIRIEAENPYAHLEH